jgi:hypothetical protein
MANKVVDQVEVDQVGDVRHTLLVAKRDRLFQRRVVGDAGSLEHLQQPELRGSAPQLLRRGPVRRRLSSRLPIDSIAAQRPQRLPVARVALCRRTGDELTLGNTNAYNAELRCKRRQIVGHLEQGSS